MGTESPNIKNEENKSSFFDTQGEEIIIEKTSRSDINAIQYNE